MFKPFSKNSIVYDVDLSYSTPKGGLQSMIAIQSSSPNIPLSPAGSLTSRQQAQLRRLSLTNQDYYYRHLRSDFTSPAAGGGSVTGVENLESSLVYGTLKKGGFFGTGNPRAFRDRINAIANDFTNAPSTKPIDNNDAKGTEKNDKSNAVDTESEVLKRQLTNDASRISPLLPFNLNLAIYGTAGIYPGDLITVDYLPLSFRKRATFVITAVKQDLSGGTWKTSLETAMKLKPIEEKVAETVKKEITPPVPVVTKKKEEPIKSPVEKEKINEKDSQPPAKKKDTGPPPLSNNKSFGGGTKTTLRLSPTANFSKNELEVHRQMNFSIAPDLFLSAKAGQFFSWPVLEQAFIKTLDPLKIPRNYPSPVFSANSEVRAIYEAYGYGIFNVEENIPIGEFTLKLSNDEKTQFNQFYKSLKVSKLNFINNTAYIHLVAGPGSEYPYRTFLEQISRVPEPYYGFGDLPEPADWITEVYGEWKSDQNGHIVAETSFTFDDLRIMSDNERKLAWRKTTRGRLHDSLEKDMENLADHFQKWYQAWYGSQMQETFAKNQFKLTYRPSGDPIANYYSRRR